MAKSREARQGSETVTQEVDNSEVQTGVAGEGATQEKERAKKGTSLSVRTRSAFMEILGEYVTTGGEVNLETIAQFVPLFEEMPVAAGSGIAPEIQIANIDTTLEKEYTSGAKNWDKIRKLLNRKQRMETLIEETAFIKAQGLSQESWDAMSTEAKKALRDKVKAEAKAKEAKKNDQGK